MMSQTNVTVLIYVMITTGTCVKEVGSHRVLGLVAANTHSPFHLCLITRLLSKCVLFQAGFSQCATEACQFLMSLPGLDARVGRRLVAHLGQCVAAGPVGLQAQPPSPKHCYSPPPSNQTTSTPGPLSVQVPSSSRLCYSPPVSVSSLSPESSPVTPFRSPQPVLSSTPSFQDLARPITGLLMTVPGKGVDSTRKAPEDLRQNQQQQPPMWRPW